MRAYNRKRKPKHSTKLNHNRVKWTQIRSSKPQTTKWYQIKIRRYSYLKTS